MSVSKLKRLKDTFSRWRRIAPSGVSDPGSEYNLLYDEFVKQAEALPLKEWREFVEWRDTHYRFPWGDSA